jgi:DNA (cytosine-5)-methyltransferase 1
MIRLAADLEPRAVMIENVRGVLTRKFDDYRAEIVGELEKLGYVICGWELLDAADYGVPQTRPRAVLVAMRPEAAAHFHWPEPSDRRVTVGQALRGSMAVHGWDGADEWARDADGTGPTLVGGSKKHGGADLGPTRARAGWRKLSVDGGGLADAPPGRNHQGLPRLTIEMAALVQGFPPDWKFQGRKTAAYRQVGNAFPPPVAEAVGRSIAGAFAAADEQARVDDPKRDAA